MRYNSFIRGWLTHSRSGRNSVDRPELNFPLLGFRLRGRLARYGAAVIAVGLVTLSRVAIGSLFGYSQPHIVIFPFVYFPVIIVVTMWGGFAAGVLASLLSTTSAAFFFVPALISSGLTHAEAIVGIVMSVVVGVTISGLADLYRRREADLRENEDRYRDLVEHSEDLLCTHDLTGKLLSVNPSPARVLGYTVPELLKINLRDLIAPEFREAFDQYLARIKANGSDRGLMAVITRAGERRIWEYNNTLRVQYGALQIVRGMAHDITERRRAEKALLTSEENYRRFVSQSSEGIFRQDLDAPVAVDLPENELVQHILRDSFIAEANDALARMYGHSSVKALLGRRLTGALDANDPTDAELAREYVRSNFRLLDRETHEVDASGNARIFLKSLIGIVENGKLLRTWGIQRDVTERVKAEQARNDAQESLRRSEERFRVALKNSPVTVFHQDRDLRYAWVYNPQHYSEKEILGKTDEDLHGPEGSAALTEIKRRVLETGSGTRVEIPISRGDKTDYFDLTLEPSLDAGRNVIGITGAAMDIAKLREMTDYLQSERDKLTQEKIYLESEIQSGLGFEKIIGHSPPLKEALRLVRLVAPADATVLLLGETGTGKELFARSIHQLSSRNNKNFIKLNCSAIPAELLESELFGFEKGAFTSAAGQKRGRLELAHEGTLFLDEIGELPLELQPKLLRALQDHEFERLGGVRTLHVDVRVITATNRDLLKEVALGRFRADLFYRLHVFPISLPPLRDRRPDIPLLVAHFIRQHAARMNKHIEGVSRETMAILNSADWPGNIRELENLIERLVILAKGPVLSFPLSELQGIQQSAAIQ